jgi:hypothetical protein
MLTFIEPADRPVVEGLEAHEVVYAKNQPEYNPLRVIRSSDKSCRVLSRWTLTPQQRAEVMGGADIYLELSTFKHPLQPVRMAVGDDVDPDYVRMEYGLPDITPIPI